MHDVGFAFSAEFAGGFDGLLGAVLFEVIIVCDLGGDKTAFEIGMNGAGGFGGGGAFLDGPGATFFFASSEERLETKSFVGGFDELT